MQVTWQERQFTSKLNCETVIYPFKIVSFKSNQSEHNISILRRLRQIGKKPLYHLNMEYKNQLINPTSEVLFLISAQNIIPHNSVISYNLS